MVDREGDCFIVTRKSFQTASLMHVVDLRRREVRQALASSQGQVRDEAAVILDRAARFRIEKILYQEWLASPPTGELSNEVWRRAVRLADSRRQRGMRVSVKELYERSMRSYWKTTVFFMYGGERWLGLFISTGRVTADMVAIVNEINAEKIHAGGRNPTTHPPPTAAPAPSRGQDVVGVQHMKRLSGQMRDQARLADKKVRWHDQNWWDAHNRAQPHGLSWRDRQRWQRKADELQAEADRQWEAAIEMSNEAGFQYKDREGS